MPPTGRRPFLSAEWRYLVMLNYAVDPAILDPLIPAGTVLDRWRDQTLVSIVGFRFDDTRVLGAAIPFHRTFDEVNLRFYVRRDAPSGEVRRGVVFVRELVPRLAVALLARWAYNEPYRAVPMRSTAPDSRVDAPGRLTYEWRTRAKWQRLAATAVGMPFAPERASEAAFITEHYWGYTRQRDGGTLEYEVTHPRWAVWTADAARFEGDADRLYGPDFAEILRGRPQSAFVAVGSPVSVFHGRRLDLGAAGTR